MSHYNILEAERSEEGYLLTFCAGFPNSMGCKEYLSLILGCKKMLEWSKVVFSSSDILKGRGSTYNNIIKDVLSVQLQQR